MFTPFLRISLLEIVNILAHCLKDVFVTDKQSLLLIKDTDIATTTDKYGK